MEEHLAEFEVEDANGKVYTVEERRARIESPASLDAPRYEKGTYRTEGGEPVIENEVGELEIVRPGGNVPVRRKQ